MHFSCFVQFEIKFIYGQFPIGSSFIEHSLTKIDRTVFVYPLITLLFQKSCISEFNIKNP